MKRGEKKITFEDLVKLQNIEGERNLRGALADLIQERFPHHIGWPDFAGALKDETTLPKIIEILLPDYIDPPIAAIWPREKYPWKNPDDRLSRQKLVWVLKKLNRMTFFKKGLNNSRHIILIAEASFCVKLTLEIVKKTDLKHGMTKRERDRLTPLFAALVPRT
jgi:hypothetical protein